MLGVKSTYDGILFQPCLPSPWDEVSVIRDFRGKQFNIALKRAKTAQLTIELNGLPVKGNIVFLKDCHSQNEVRVNIPVVNS
jgi:N,N'-diacetylchitobiose phosphorylase